MNRTLQARLGRTEPACAIRHSIVLKQDRWIEFARSYREKRAAGEASDTEGESEVGEKDEQAEDAEMKEAGQQEDSEPNNEDIEAGKYDDKKAFESGEKEAVEEK